MARAQSTAGAVRADEARAFRSIALPCKLAGILPIDFFGELAESL